MSLKRGSASPMFLHQLLVSLILLASLQVQVMSQVQGVIVIARGGDRSEFYQDPKTYAPTFTETTPLGEVQCHALGSLLRNEYFVQGSPSFIQGIRAELVDTHQVAVRVKGGGEGPVVFDSAIATLQGLFPPTPKNTMTLSNGMQITAPLGGYQYVPVQTVEPDNDRSMESWTDCPAFQKHVEAFHKSEEFKKKAAEAEPFFKGVKDFIFGREETLENIWNVYDFINSELAHNQTYAFRLPPSYKDQAQALADYHEAGVFGGKELGGIGNIAGRSTLATVLETLERIAFNGDPLQFMLLESSYQPLISILKMTGLTKDHPELEGIPDYASALVIELRRGAPPDTRDFLRFKFKNGTNDFETLHAFGHNADIPLTEFIFRTENYVISSNSQWKSVCGASFAPFQLPSFAKLPTIGAKSMSQTASSCIFAFFALFGLFIFSSVVRRNRARNAEGRLRLPGAEVTGSSPRGPPHCLGCPCHPYSPLP
ncbi:phosphoglycerate mutase-like protein [Athelia psychrophila]|uniref:Phosphoglycerate mutase-like protein n=1 Tax=Athelia psychrophila TaxID=1759441 RepID=A0A165WID4_9AGAM|nr:phosphoglycerate mutase-like protein [Fibularhizoctonia sp. CBS 109695]